MPSSKHESTTRMYKEWRDARPAVPVPFKYKAKGEGKIEQSWKDIRDKMNRDATSYSLAFCTAHLAPSTAQANVLQELSIRDEKLAKKNRELEEALHREQAQNQQEIGEHGLSNHREWLSDVEKDVPLQSEGGGRGRAAFMKERNKLPLNVRYGLMARTNNQSYGWAQLNNDHYSELKESCSKRQVVEGRLLPDIKNSSSGIQKTRATVALQQSVPFVSEFVPADVARQSQIPPEFASLGARPNNSIPFALSVIGGADKKNKKSSNNNDSNNNVNDDGGSEQQSVSLSNLAEFSLGGSSQQGPSHRHARGDFRKRTFQASTRATGVFPGSEFVG